jgi:hypothetical protein
MEKSRLASNAPPRSEMERTDEPLIILQTLLLEHQPRCLVIDPVSALMKAGGSSIARDVTS